MKTLEGWNVPYWGDDVWTAPQPIATNDDADEVFDARQCQAETNPLELMRQYMRQEGQGT